MSRLFALPVALLIGALAACSMPAPPAAETAAPVETAAPTAAAMDWLASFGDFEPESYSGSGALEIDLPEGATGGIVTATYSGDANFRISPRDATGEPSERNLVNHVGSYSGTTAWGLSKDDIAVLLIDAESGDYEITVSPMSSAPAFAIPASGVSDAVFISELDAASYVLKNLSPDRPLTASVETADGGENARAEANAAAPLVLLGGVALIIVHAEMTAWEITK